MNKIFEKIFEAMPGYLYLLYIIGVAMKFIKKVESSKQKEDKMEEHLVEHSDNIENLMGLVGAGTSSKIADHHYLHNNTHPLIIIHGGIKIGKAAVTQGKPVFEAFSKTWTFYFVGTEEEILDRMRIDTINNINDPKWIPPNKRSLVDYIERVCQDDKIAAILSKPEK